MRDLIKQEQFELEILNFLNSKRLLEKMVFTGGTMLRLCFGLNRFSVDLDFWLKEKADAKELAQELKECLEQNYELTDFADKFFTILAEIRSKKYPRRLKIEIRKDRKNVRTERNIAYSPFSNLQILVETPTMEEMIKAKTEAALKRKEIRDVFDIEFLAKKGVEIKTEKNTAKKLLSLIESFSEKDYKIKLGGLLEEKERKYYQEANFKILKIKLEKFVTQPQ